MRERGIGTLNSNVVPMISFVSLLFLFALLWMLVQLLPSLLFCFTRARLWRFKGFLITARYRNPKSVKGKKMKLGTETGEDETSALHRRGSNSTSNPDYLACSADKNLLNARVAVIGSNCKLSRSRTFI